MSQTSDNDDDYKIQPSSTNHDSPPNFQEAFRDNTSAEEDNR